MPIFLKRFWCCIEKHINISLSASQAKTISRPSASTPEQIKRCIINLLDNAVAALKEKGHIDISLSIDKQSNNVLLKVADDGPGISKENKLKLFEPYFSTKKTGTGLGLAIVSTIVSDHGGYIRVQDNSPQGSIFVIELPVSAHNTFPEHSHSEF